MTSKIDQPILTFYTQSEWEQWLAKNYDTSDGVWIKIFKKGSNIKGLTYAEALDEALCYGWIDGLVNSFDDAAFIQRFTPRRSRSIWSKRNTEHIERLTKLGRMKPSGLAEVEKAQADGRWDNAYPSPANTTPPKDFLNALSKSKKAQQFFETLNKSNTFAIIWNINNAKKEETRHRRIKKYIEMLERGEKLH